MACCSGRCTEPHLLLLSGSDLSGVVGSLTRGGNAPVYSTKMEYLPGETVPLSTSAPTPNERTKAVVGRAMEASQQGAPVILACDAWGNQNSIVSVGLSAGVDTPASSALLHTPLSTLVSQSKTVEKLNRSLTDFGALYKGTTEKKGSLQFITPNNVNAAAAALKRLPSESGDHTPSDVETLSGILRHHLLTSLSLDRNPSGVYVVPRGKYDHVVHAHRRNETNANRVAALMPPRTPSVLTATPPPGGVLNLHYPHFCEGCMKAASGGRSDAHVACGKCMGHMRDIFAKQQNLLEQ